ncbi:MAG TPA: MFS transporter [Patescibacteria group bacterium]|nr:MFS transporter [Patescibacteria group bacterium]
MNGPSVANANAMRSFRHRNFRLFFGGQAVSLAGSWMQSVAQAWLVLTLTNDPLILGVVAAAQWTPVLVLGLFGGVIADALPKRPTLIALQAVMAALAVVLGVLTLAGVVEVWMILVLAILLGCANAIEMPVRQAFAVELVGRVDVVNAVALNSATFNAARVIGPAVAGITIAAFDISSAFFVNGASFLAVIVGLLLMRPDELHAGSPISRPRTVREVLASVGEGISYARRTPAVLLAVVVVGLAATIGMNFQVTIPPFVRDVLRGDAAAFGFLMTASGLGSVVAALYLATRRRPSAWAIPVGATLLGVGLLLAAFLPVYGVAMSALAVAGFGAIWMAANGNTLIQATVPDELRGRVISVYTTVFAGSTPFGALFAGFIASRWGAVAALAVGGALTLAVGVIALAWLRRHRAIAAGPVEHARALMRNAAGRDAAEQPAGTGASGRYDD